MLKAKAPHEVELLLLMLQTVYGFRMFDLHDGEAGWRKHEKAVSIKKKSHQCAMAIF
jgi:hypothetical protein